MASLGASHQNNILRKGLVVLKEASVFTKISAYNLSTESNLFLKIGYGGQVIFFERLRFLGATMVTFDMVCRYD